ncbi:hypothetical protein EWB00_009353 [Schistosoma japonicum]|uniref:Uncharacterized protein n=1 Tax=Schistosoma japonicum TaxID=6182 RepID=A0A4Z2DRT0_SCHJA|nr:hypothetical protein EWB00_009352 [Schistosoma japonicum]TNN19107.1 hypothetical protein EWB00_009353 [Schistosoma japonicum]
MNIVSNKFTMQFFALILVVLVVSFECQNSVIAEPVPERKGGCCSGACPQCPRCCGCRRCGDGGCSGGCCGNCPRDY